MHTFISPCQYYEQINQNILYINLFLIGLNLFITQLDHLKIPFLWAIIDSNSLDYICS